MARLQILELPEGNGDDRPPFVLIVDQVDGDAAEAIANADLTTAELIGARAVLVFEETIDIPANDTTAYLDAVAGDSLPAAEEESGPKCRYCGADCAEGRPWDGGDLYACGPCSDWRAKLNQHKAALLDTLGMDHTRDWDDIRNAAAGIRKQRDDQAAAIERVRQLHRPVEFRDRGTICAECSGWDGNTTDNSPCGYEHCPTLKALDGKQPGA